MPTVSSRYTKRPLLSGTESTGRFYAFILDHFIALAIALAGAGVTSAWSNGARLALLLAAYCAYFGLSEGLFARTPGKAIFGLMVVRSSGARCGWGAIALRTALRLLETNPLVLGGLPAALVIRMSARNQRIGDMFADTIVVQRPKQEST